MTDDASQKQHISCYELCTKQYSLEELEAHADTLEMRTVLNTQKLTAEFCVRHMLNLQPPDCSWEDWYFFDDRCVLARQKHLSQEDLDEARRKIAETSNE